VQPGNLVKITRASIGIPIGTIGLILKVFTPYPGSQTQALADIQICNAEQRTVRRLERDLEVI